MEFSPSVSGTSQLALAFACGNYAQGDSLINILVPRISDLGTVTPDYAMDLGPRMFVITPCIFVG